MLAALLAALLVLVGAAVHAARRRRPAEAPSPPARAVVVAAAVAPTPSISGPVAPPRDTSPLAALDALLAELESTTVRLDGADELDERAVVDLEGLAARLEAAAATFASR